MNHIIPQKGLCIMAMASMVLSCINHEPYTSFTGIIMSVSSASDVESTEMLGPADSKSPTNEPLPSAVNVICPRPPADDINENRHRDTNTSHTHTPCIHTHTGINARATHRHKLTPYLATSQWRKLQIAPWVCLDRILALEGIHAARAKSKPAQCRN